VTGFPFPLWTLAGHILQEPRTQKTSDSSSRSVALLFLSLFCRKEINDLRILSLRRRETTTLRSRRLPVMEFFPICVSRRGGTPPSLRIGIISPFPSRAEGLVFKDLASSFPFGQNGPRVRVILDPYT